MQPGFFAALSQLLPPGAALTALRNAEYFDWAATLAPLLVLGGWAAGGVACGLLGEERQASVAAAGAATWSRVSARYPTADSAKATNTP